MRGGKRHNAGRKAKGEQPLLKTGEIKEIKGETVRCTVGQTRGLMPPWQPGESGNPKGRQPAGLFVTEWYNAMVDYTAADLQVVIEDPESPSAKVAAAQQWLQARDGKLASLVEVCDRTHGQSLRRSDVTTHDEPRTESERAEARDRVLARIRGRITRTA